MENKIQISIFTREDFTDKSIVDFLAKRNSLSIKEYSDFLSNIKVYNDVSENVIRFIASYEGGFFRPDKCNAYEPVNKRFNGDDLSGPISWLSQPGGAFYFKKTKGFKLDGAIENRRFSPIWSDDNLLKPTVQEPTYLGEIKLFIEGEIVRIKGLEYWLGFVEHFCTAAKTKTAVLQAQDESNNVQIKENEILISEPARKFFI